jgi:hypothetical protein
MRGYSTDLHTQATEKGFDESYELLLDKRRKGHVRYFNNSE